LFEVELGEEVTAPDELAGGEVEALQAAFGAEGEDAAARDDGAGARAGVEAVAIAVGARRGVAPEALAIGGAQAVDDFFVADAVEENEVVAEDRRGGEALAFFHFPYGAEAVGGEAREERGLGRDHVVRRAEKRRPVGRDGAGREGFRRGVKRGVGVRLR
jgi:hypothetical protein